MVWAEPRRFAVEFLKEAQGRLHGSLGGLFEKAVEHSDAVARDFKAVSDAYPFKDCDDEMTKADERVHAAAALLKEARDAEAAGLDMLAELATKLAP